MDIRTAQLKHCKEWSVSVCAHNICYIMCDCIFEGLVRYVTLPSILEVLRKQCTSTEVNSCFWHKPHHSSPHTLPLDGVFMGPARCHLWQLENEWCVTKVFSAPSSTQSELCVSLTLHLRWGCVCPWCPLSVSVVGGAARPLGVMMQSSAAGEDKQQLYYTLYVQLNKNTGQVVIK